MQFWELKMKKLKFFLGYFDAKGYSMQKWKILYKPKR